MEFIKSICKVYLQNPELFIILVALIILCILLEVFYPKFRGYMGEFWVRKELEKLPKDEYILLNDIMIQDENGTHQIDHIVLSNYGLFVIEMKNYYGRIKGEEFNHKWCQYLGRNRYYFYNPIHQNYGHIESLSNLLNIDRNFFVSIICFSNQARLNIKSKSIVTQVDFVKTEILRFSQKSNHFDIGHMKDIILSHNIIDKKQRREHVAKIYEKKHKNLSLEENMICPKCHGTLVERKGKYGNFIGCSNFPNCRYIKK